MCCFVTEVTPSLGGLNWGLKPPIKNLYFWTVGFSSSRSFPLCPKHGSRAGSFTSRRPVVPASAHQMSEKNRASSEIGEVLQKILARLDAIEQHEQQQDAVEALSSGRRDAAADDGSRINASVDEPASDRGGPSPDPSSVASAASTGAILVDSLGEPDPKNKNCKHFKFIDAVWTSAFLHPGTQSSLTKADAKHATCTSAPS